MGKSHLGIYPDEPLVEVHESDVHLDIANLWDVGKSSIVEMRSDSKANPSGVILLRG
jgi:hypothetical protein